MLSLHNNIRRHRIRGERSGLVEQFDWTNRFSRRYHIRVLRPRHQRWYGSALPRRMSPMSRESSELKALCVGRHRYLSDHFGQFFRKLGVDAVSVVGISDAIAAAHEHVPDVVFCEYDLLATVPLESWERDPLLSRIPVIAVSLTRRSDEMHLLDVNNIAGFFYLPSLTEDDARRLLHAVRPSAGYSLRSSFDRPIPSSASPA
jgi:hypothetical protein